MSLTFSRYNILERGTKAPDFNLIATDGKKYSLIDFKDSKMLLIVFMCNHCPYVIPKLPFLIALQEKYKDQGLNIVGINSNDSERYLEDSFEKMKEYYKKYEFNFIYLFDETQKVAKEYGATCTPDLFLFDSDLKLVYHGRIDDVHAKLHSEANTNELEDAIKLVLDCREVNFSLRPSCGCNIKWK